MKDYTIMENLDRVIESLFLKINILIPKDSLHAWGVAHSIPLEYLKYLEDVIITFYVDRTSGLPILGGAQFGVEKEEKDKIEPTPTGFPTKDMGQA